MAEPPAGEQDGKIGGVVNVRGPFAIYLTGLQVLQVIPEENLILIKGSIPGAMNSIVEIVKL